MASVNSQIPLAHVRQDSRGQWQLHGLEEHLRAVGEIAAGFAEEFGASEWARLAGLWHDLGKYSPAFQGYIRRESGFDPEAHIESSGGKVNHSSAGALHAAAKLPGKGQLLAYLIAGHHAGLADWHGDENGAAALSRRLKEEQHLKVLPTAAIPSDVLHPHIPITSKPLGGEAGLALWLRMLFSCLVDADFLDTETFMDGDKHNGRGGYASLAHLLEIFDAHMNRFAATATPTPVNRVRADVLRQCREGALDDPGIFSLTVPTGGGKTLSSLAFALTHAVRREKQKRRVIYVIPYTSIIEQTADTFRGIFGEQVIEHHSNLDPDQETAKSRLAAENWDAPLIVTTSVQFFESLFAVRTSRCRKLHNIINSVVVLDEAQLLPPAFLLPILSMMKLLTKYYGVTFVLSTATQPALHSRSGFGWRFDGLDGVREIIADPDALYRSLERVTVTMPEDYQARGNWQSVAEELQRHASVLAVVNTRADCREIHGLMPRGTLHLSAAMCGAHRAKVIADIKARLHDKVPTRVVSTQLVEAGVDVDFPVVYRALAGLDSIAQAAGRCNREGKQDRGHVVVFVPPKPSPSGVLRHGEQTTVGLFSGTTADPMAREQFTRYFELFYSRVKSLDEHEIMDLLTTDARQGQIQFRTAAQRFRLIDDAESAPVFVWYDEGRSLIEKLEKDGPERRLMRKLQRYSVNLPRRIVMRLLAEGIIREVWPGTFAQAVDTFYSDEVGVVLEGSLAAEQLVF